MASFTSSPLSARILAWMTLFLSLSPLWARGESPTVKVNGTTIVGKSNASASNVTVEFFGGIPFAKPPIGELRFAPPVALETLGVPTLNATTFGAPCVQFGVDDSPEDCPTLNVFCPSESVLSNQTLVRLLLWRYGGGFELGASSLYDASEIIAQSVLRETPIVYVSINYRVGPFGFPQGAEAGERGAVNLGLKDELAALAWVQKHISAFSGDPTKITLFGQSAGLVSIAYLYLNAELENYCVRGTIMEPGFARALPLFNASRRDRLWDAFVGNTTECAGVPRGSTFSCLHNATTTELLSSWEAVATAIPELYLFVPVLDGPSCLLPDLSSTLLSEGHFSRIPFIAGTVLDEGTDLVPQDISNDDELLTFLIDAVSPHPHEIIPQLEKDLKALTVLYPDDPALGSPFGTGNETFGLSSEYKRVAAMLGDMSFQAPRGSGSGWRQPRAYRHTVEMVQYGYIFADQNAAETNPSLRVQHVSEVPYVYGSRAIEEANAGSGLVSRAMLDYWLSFTVSGTPNHGKGLPKTVWPQYETGNQGGLLQVLLQFDTTKLSSELSNATFAIAKDDYRSQQIGYIISLGPDFNE